MDRTTFASYVLSFLFMIGGVSITTVSVFRESTSGAIGGVGAIYGGGNQKGFRETRGIR